MECRRNGDISLANVKGEQKTTTQNKVKPDVILKKFWRDNDRFADLFNATLFNGEMVVDPNDLMETNANVSSVLKVNGHVETLEKVLDVVKKTAYGVEFIILGLENQENIHYAMPLRHMVGDALCYLKEYQEIAEKNKREVKEWKSVGEFLSRMKKTDRLHPVISICVYYGETEWDGPFCLKDMLVIPEALKPVVSDYQMNLLELNKCENIPFHNKDVKTVFEISKMIYNKEYGKIQELCENQEIDTELALTIGAITRFQRLINNALSSEQKGEQVNMCKALEELEQQGILRGEMRKTIQLVIKKVRKNYTSEETAEMLEEDLTVVQRIYEIAKKYAPDYDEEKICEELMAEH